MKTEKSGLLNKGINQKLNDKSVIQQNILPK